MKRFREFMNKLRSLLLILVIATGQVAAATGPFIKPATAGATNNNNDDKIRICHRSASYTNPYQDIEVSKSAADGIAGNSGNTPDHYGEHQGPIFYPTIPKHTEWGDIIPPIAGVHAGYNWTSEGQSIWNNECEFKKGDIDVDKRVDNDGNGDFELGTTDSNPEKTAINNLGFRWSYNEDTPAFLMGEDEENLPAGNYNVTENTVAGYQFVSWYVTGSGKSCTNPNGTTLPVPVTVEDDETEKVTFCNKKIINNASITIIKDAVPDHERDFLFTTTGSGLSGFSLDDDADPTLSNTKTFPGLAAGTYTVSEDAVNGWEVTGIDCGQSSGVTINGSTVSFSLAAGQSVTCTYKNEHKKGSIKVLKQVDEGEGYVAAGASSPFKWGLDGGTVNRDMGTTQGNVLVGNRSVTENSVTGYELAGWYIGQGSCTNQQNSKTLPVTTNVQQNQTTTVTFCNKAKDEIKITLCHATGSEQNPFVSISISPAGAFNGHLGAGHQNGEDIIPPFQFNNQTYSQNWDSTGQAIYRNGCKKPSNSKISGYKFHDVNGNGQKDGVLEPKIGGWTIYLFKVGNPNPIATTATSNSLSNYGNFSFSNLPAGEYKVCEAHPAGWAQIVPNPLTDTGCYLVSLNGNNQVDGIIFGNQARAKITVIKNVDRNGDGDTKDEGEQNNPNWQWNYWSLLDSDTNVPTGDTVVVRTGVAGAFYLLSENQKAGYDLTDVDCNQHFWRIGDSVKVFATVGDEIVCTFTNTKRAKVVIEKKADPEDGTDFHFTLSKHNPNHHDNWLPALNNQIYGNHPYGHDKEFTLDDADPDDGDNYTNKEYLSLKTGKTYYITEEQVEGWDLDKIYCNRGTQWYRDGNTLVLTLNDAEDVRCWFKNEKQGEVVVTKFNDYDRDGKKDENEPVLSGWDMNLKSEDCEEDVYLFQSEDYYDGCDYDYSYDKTQTTGDGGTEGVTTFSGVKPGEEHTLSETEQPENGWHWSNTYCEYPEQQDERGYLEEPNNYELYVSPGETLNCFVGNYHDVELTLTKSNNRPNPTTVGDTVTYTLVASLSEQSGALFGATVTDLPPAGFSYVPGSWTAVSNFRGNLVPGTTPEPTYGSPGTWLLGDMLPGEVVTLTYLAKIAASVSDGTYPDVAFAQGCALPVGEGCADEEVVLSNVHFADNPFVATKVTVKSPQVLGASTTVLVNTGMADLWRTVMASTLLLGLAIATMVTREKKGGRA